MIQGAINLKSNQAVQLTAGNVASLSGISQVNIIYDYTEMQIGKYLGEEEYLREEMRGYGKDTTNARKFRQRWVHNHYMAFEPGFEASFNEAGKEIGMSGTNYSSANAVTLKVLITSLDYGYNAVYVTEPASVSAECTFADQEGNILVRYWVRNAQHRCTMNETKNIIKCYRKAAELLADQIASDRQEKK